MTAQPATTGSKVGDTLAAACAGLRRGQPQDAVTGIQPAWVAAPATVAQAAATMRAAADLGLAVVPRGSGSRLSWGLPPRGCDLVIETGNLDHVVEHAAGDWVASVQAGVRMERLAEVLGRAGQRLSLDVPAPAGGDPGTVGGVLATGMAGPLRLRYGTPRDLLTGMTVVRADGRVARSGGKVVKNVAGYDLGKLFAGSFGTLGLIVEATFRLHPVPAAVAYLTLERGTAAEAAAAVAAAVESQLLASAVEIDRAAPGAPVKLGVLVEGSNRPGLAERAAQMRALLGPGAEVAGEAPGWWGHGAAAANDSTLVRIAFWPGELRSVLEALDRAAAAARLEPAVSGSPGAGVLYAAVDSLAEPQAVGRFVSALRAVAGRAGGGYPPVRGSVVVLNAPHPVREVADMWGPVPGAGLMRAVKDQFDPEHRMAPGRFAGGI